MVHHFSFPSRREKHKEWCIQLIGRICEVKTYLQWTRICIFLKKGEQLYLVIMWAGCMHSRAKITFGKLLLRKHTEGLSQVKKEASCFTGKQIRWWVTRAYGELWHCNSILRSPGANSAWPWPQTSLSCVILSSVAEEVHSSPTELKFPFRSRIWSRVCKIQVMGEGEQTISPHGFFNGQVHVNLVLCPTVPMNRKCFLWLLLTKNAGSQCLGFLSSVYTQ